jgi:hypothetical protein
VACTARTPRKRSAAAQAVSAMDTGEAGDLGSDGLSASWRRATVAGGPGRRVGNLGQAGLRPEEQ